MNLNKDAHTSAEHHFLECLFRHLRQAGVSYAVLRNYETLPHSAGGSDLDILVHPEDEESARAAIADAIRKAGGVALGYAGKKDFFTLAVFGRGGADSAGWWGILIDVYVEWRYASTARLVDVNVLKNRFALHNGIRILPCNLSVVLAVLKMLLHKDELSVRYMTGVTPTTIQNWDDLWVDMWPIGRPAFQLLREMCLMEPDSAAILPKSHALRRMVLQEAFARSPLTYFRDRLSHVWFKVRRFLRSPGLVIAVLGTDGTGKSTVISAIEPALSAATHGAFIVKHLRPGLLPPLARLKGKQTHQEGPVTDPQGAKPSGGFGSLLRVLYLMADYVLGYWLVVRPKIAKQPGIILFDRYAYDMAIDPRRFRIALPRQLLRWFTRFAPKPDLIICLHGDPVVIAARKQELPLEEVKRQTEALLEFAKHESRAVLVATEGTVEQTRDSVLTALQEFCERRTKGCLQRGV